MEAQPNGLTDEAPDKTNSSTTSALSPPLDGQGEGRDSSDAPSPSAELPVVDVRIQTDRYGPINGRFKDRYSVTTEAKLLPFTPVGRRSHSGPTDDSVGLPPEIAEQLEVGDAFVLPDRYGKPLPGSCWEVVEKAPSVWPDHPEWVRIFVKPKREPATDPMRVGGISTGEFSFRPNRRAA